MTRRAVQYVAAISSVIIGILPGIANAAGCNGFEKFLTPGKLYAIPSGCQAFKCATKLGNGTNKLNPGSYRILYSTNVSNTRNSLVVVHRKYLPNVVNDETTDRVLVRRDKTPFACKKSEPGPVPDVGGDDDEARSKFSDLSYAGYDHFNRSGYANSEEERFLDRKIHLSYNNGVDKHCVSSRSPERRQWFVLEQRGGVQWPLAAIIARLFGGGSPALAGSTRYAEVRVNVFNYQKQGGQTACVSFPIDPSYKDVELGVFDVEDLVQFQANRLGLPAIEWKIHFGK